jgi:hypothetical protein
VNSRKEENIELSRIREIVSKFGQKMQGDLGERQTKKIKFY